MVGALAAAFASGGRFSEAVDTAKKAIELANAANRPQIKNNPVPPNILHPGQTVP